MSDLVFDFCDTSRVIEELPPDDPQVTSMNGWDFSAKPKTPYRRTFKATLHGLRWYQSLTGQLYGPELVPNPGFGSSTSWTLVQGFTIQNSQLTSSLINSDYAWANLLGSFLTGEVYELVVAVTDAGSSSLRVRVGTSPNGSNILSSQTLNQGENRFVMTVSTDIPLASITFQNNGTPTKVTKVSSVTLRKRTGTVVTTLPLEPLTNIHRNAGRLIEFYKLHRLWDSFLINHEYLGLIRVRFNKPVQIPAAKAGGIGYCDPVEIELIEHNPSYT